MDWNYITERVNRYKALPLDASAKHDELLYRIGSHVDALTAVDCQFIDGPQKGQLTSEQRYQVLDWIASCSTLLDADDIDLALLIFGHQQLEEWLQISRQAYPDFEFYLVFEYQDSKKTGWTSGINFTMHWAPKVGAPEPSVECDFPWKPYWECGGMFWGDYPGGSTNQFDFNLYCYPNQQSFATPNSFCEEGSRYTMPDDRDADLMSVAQVLEHFAVPA